MYHSAPKWLHFGDLQSHLTLTAGIDVSVRGLLRNWYIQG